MEVSSRTMQGRFLLLPAWELVEIILGTLARAQVRYGMVIHGFIFLSDHFHMLLSPDDGRQLADFMCYVKSNIAREAGKMHGWEGNFWGGRYESIVISNEKEAQESRLKYILANGCKEGLVASPKDWPGASVALALLSGSNTLMGKWFDRSKEYRSRLNGKQETYESEEVVTLTPLPCWEGLTDEEIMQRVAEMIGEIEEETAAMHAKEGTKPLGAKKVINQHPHSVPKKMKKSPAPLFITATREAMRELREIYNAFISAYRAAAEKLRAGHLNVIFPPGSFPPPRPYVPEATPG
jgi:hypothetical protein